MTERKVYHIDVGSMSRKEAEELLARIKGQKVVPWYKDILTIERLFYAITIIFLVVVNLYILAKWKDYHEHITASYGGVSE